MIILNLVAENDCQQAIKDYLEENNIAIAPLKVNIDGTDYLDGVDLERNEFYEILTSTEVFPKTSQPSPQNLVDIFEDVKEKGDECICIMLSSGLSGTYQATVLAKDIVEYENIHLIDSKTVSCGTQILVREAIKMIMQGCNAQEIIDKLEEMGIKDGDTVDIFGFRFDYLS